MDVKNKYEPLVEHAGHNWLMIRGNWGPHKAKYICADCDGKFVKWASIQQNKTRVYKYCYAHRQTESRTT